VKNLLLVLPRDPDAVIAAAVLGNAFHKVALLGGAAKLPALGKAIAGWQFSRSMLNLVCSPRSPEQYPGAVLDTLVLVLVLKGGPTSITVPKLGGGGGLSFSNGVAALKGMFGDSYVIKVNSQAVSQAPYARPSSGCFRPPISSVTNRPTFSRISR
jgi:hypothetical protein